MIILVSGCSGSGKTTFADGFNPDSSVVIRQDDFYLGNWNSQKGNAKDWDHPESCNLLEMFKCISKLKYGLEVDIPIYDFLKQERVGVRHVMPKPYVVVDGIWCLTVESIRCLGDLKIYIEVPFKERLNRLIKRDVSRGRDKDKTIEYQKHVEEMADIWVKPYKKYADLIIETGK